MTMFISQMIHDGTFDAYSVKHDGEEVSLVYDMKKDKRFDIFCKFDGNIDACPARLKDDFKKQKALYEIMRDDMKDDDHPLVDPNKAETSKD